MRERTAEFESAGKTGPIAEGHKVVNRSVSWEGTHSPNILLPSIFLPPLSLSSLSSAYPPTAPAHSSHFLIPSCFSALDLNPFVTNILTRNDLPHFKLVSQFYHLAPFFLSLYLRRTTQLAQNNLFFFQLAHNNLTFFQLVHSNLTT